MIRKSILAFLLAVELMFAIVPLQAEAASSCKHKSQEVQITKTPTGGYNHSYTGSDGITKGCGVTVGTYTARYTCLDCGNVGTSTGTYEDHDTNHT